MNVQFGGQWNGTKSRTKLFSPAAIICDPFFRHVSKLSPGMGLCYGLISMTIWCTTFGAYFPRTEHKESICWVSTPPQCKGRCNWVISWYTQSLYDSTWKVWSRFSLISSFSWTLSKRMDDLSSTNENCLNRFWAVRSLTAEAFLNVEHIVLVAFATLFTNLNS